MSCSHCDECGACLFQAGELVPAGAYLRVDDESFQRVSLVSNGALPASFDGHVALYRAAATPCACELRRRLPAHAGAGSHVATHEEE
ncbi:MAG TPA: hypothetical protein VIC27_06950 [Ktedonobacterales bacterium]|jgi:hypothetical protein